MKQSYYFIFLTLMILIGCKKEFFPPEDLSKVKTLNWYDSTNNLLASYFFIYDSIGNLINVKNDTSNYLMYEKPALDSIILKYREYDIGINFVDKRVHFNVDNNIESIYDYNVTNDYQFLEYSFDFNGDILQTIFESYKPVLLFYPVQGPTNTDYVFNGNNYTQFISTWEASWIPAGPSFTIVDTVSYEFTTLLNNGKIPLQFPLRNYTWNQFNFKIFPFGSNILYMLNAKGIGKKVNKNLIHSITIRGSENLTLIYDYVFNSNNQIIEMKISNSETGAITNSFKMTYYE